MVAFLVSGLPSWTRKEADSTSFKTILWENSYFRPLRRLAPTNHCNPKQSKINSLIFSGYRLIWAEKAWIKHSTHSRLSLNRTSVSTLATASKLYRSRVTNFEPATLVWRTSSIASNPPSFPNKFTWLDPRFSVRLLHVSRELHFWSVELVRDVELLEVREGTEIVAEYLPQQLKQLNPAARISHSPVDFVEIRELPLLHLIQGQITAWGWPLSTWAIEPETRWTALQNHEPLPYPLLRHIPDSEERR